MTFNLKISNFISVYLILLHLLKVSYTSTQSNNVHFNERERYSRTRFLPSKYSLNKTVVKTTKPLFTWDLIENNVTSTINKLSSVNTNLNEPNKQGNNQNELHSIKRKKMRRRRVNVLQENNISNNKSEIFIWKLRKDKNNTKLRSNKKRRPINVSSNQFLSVNLNRTTTNSSNVFRNEPSSAPVVFLGDDKNKRAITKYPIPKINYDKNVENVSISLLLKDLLPFTTKWNHFDDRKKFRKNNSRCSVKNCDHFCHDKGTKICSCLDGFVLESDGKTCSDVNECLINNGGCQYTCYNTPGSFYCDCPKGLRISSNLRTCEDVNECLLRNGHGPCQDTCRNIYGSYVCSCSKLKGTKLSPDKHTCKMNECYKNNGGCSHKCINSLGRSFCTCPNGLELGEDWKTCYDINECNDDELAKNCPNGCKNTIGSYECLNLLQESQSDQNLSKCSSLRPPKHGFLRCNYEKESLISSYLKEMQFKNSLGSFCELICFTGYKIVGTFKVHCAEDGVWKGKMNGRCQMVLGRNYDPNFNYIHVKWALPPPKIICPKSRILHLKKGDDKALITLHPPKTNVDWRNVKGYPRWIKDLRANLLPGYHSFSFVATNPHTDQSDTCSFYIIIKKPFYYS